MTFILTIIKSIIWDYVYVIAVPEIKSIHILSI